MTLIQACCLGSKPKTFSDMKRNLKCIKSLQTPFHLCFNDNIYHEGNISKMPDFDVFFSLLDIRKRNRRSRGKRKNGNLKRKHKNETF